MPAFSHPWGAERAYTALLGDACPLVVLDVPDETAGAGLERSVSLLSDYATLVVLTREHTDPVRLLRAGAVNVLSRDLPPRELAGRLTAERRRLPCPASARSAPRHRTTGPNRPCTRSPSASCSSCSPPPSAPLCCHDLRLLLGDGTTPLSMRALRGRTNRLQERLAGHGMAVRCTSQWGRTTYLGIHDGRR